MLYYVLSIFISFLVNKNGLYSDICAMVPHSWMISGCPAHAVKNIDSVDGVFQGSRGGVGDDEFVTSR